MKRWVLWKAFANEDLIDEILKICDPSSALILLEAGWLNKKSNYRKTAGRRVSEAISRKVGQNQASGQLLMRMLEKQGFIVKEIKPLVKGVLKRDGSWTVTGRKFIEENTGIKSRINDEVRDALFIVLISNQRALF
ncbi:hypothetical protein [Dyadobacter sp. Leaf189]|uniref:hypothetical protein n=1 Tax=Dyadobacter sp. Leaf189 TaxID=1736295 RepID=UPI0012F83B90|nr:hypothetical protein [Dyadobacter sp. Leaf189]